MGWLGRATPGFHAQLVRPTAGPWQRREPRGFEEIRTVASIRTPCSQCNEYLARILTSGVISWTLSAPRTSPRERHHAKLAVQSSRLGKWPFARGHYYLDWSALLGSTYDERLDARAPLACSQSHSSTDSFLRPVVPVVARSHQILVAGVVPQGVSLRSPPCQSGSVLA